MGILSEQKYTVLLIAVVIIGIIVYLAIGKKEGTYFEKYVEGLTNLRFGNQRFLTAPIVLFNDGLFKNVL